MKKIGAFFVIFFIGVFLISAAAAQHTLLHTETTEVTGDKVVSIVKTIVGGGVTGASGSDFIQKLADSQLFSRILIFLLVLLILYAITPWIPFIGEKNWIAFMVSAIVAILATLYLEPAEIVGVIYPYKALGLLIVGLLPFCAAAVIAKRLYEKEHIYLSKLVWAGFAVLMFVLLWNAPGNYMWIYLAILLLSLVMLFFERPIFFRMMKTAMKGNVQGARGEYIADLNAQLQRNLELQKSATGEVLTQLQNKQAELVRKISNS